MFYRLKGILWDSGTLGRMLRLFLGENMYDQRYEHIADAEVERVFYDLETDAPVVHQDYYCQKGDVVIYDLSQATKVDLVMKSWERATTFHFEKSANSDEWTLDGETPYRREARPWSLPCLREFLGHVRFYRTNGDYPMPKVTYDELERQHRVLQQWHLRYAGERPTNTMPKGWRMPRELNAYAMKADELYPMDAARNLGIAVPTFEEQAEESDRKT